jgi:hypothetical protein
MSDIELVIKIPKDSYEATCNGCMLPPDVENVVNAIKNGTPLPEHHGRLIDADELRRTMEKDVRKAMSFVDLTDFVWLAPTIIEGSDSECQG